jgi:hypothetical protein
MAIYGEYDNNGKYLGFYDDTIHRLESIPTGSCIIITDEQRTEIMQSIDEYRVVDGVHTYVPYTQDDLVEQKLESLRAQRNSLLKTSDWVVLPYSPITGSKLDEWVEYRQKLRDITETTGSILDVEIPEKPE